MIASSGQTGDPSRPTVHALEAEDDDSLSGGEVIARPATLDGMKRAIF
jgi:hypothetical protein